MSTALARLPLSRLLRTPRTVLTVGAWAALAIGFAVAARAQGASHGADRALVDAFGALVVPLLCYAIAGGALGADSLSAAGASAVAFGATPRRTAATTIATILGASVASCAVLGAAVAIVAHGSADAPVARDALASAYASALGGAAYASLFALGSAFGRRGGGRTVALVADWLLGANTTVVAFVTPRAHLRNLLGGTPPAALGERLSAVALLLLAALFALLALRRAR
ncbi:MAG TPA: hypothetical protein VF765_13665 [Polyangiaceae bacterium]